MAQWCGHVSPRLRDVERRFGPIAEAKRSGLGRQELSVLYFSASRCPTISNPKRGEGHIHIHFCLVRGRLWIPFQVPPTTWKGRAFKHLSAVRGHRGDRQGGPLATASTVAGLFLSGLGHHHYIYIQIKRIKPTPFSQRLLQTSMAKRRC